MRVEELLHSLVQDSRDTTRRTEGLEPECQPVPIVAWTLIFVSSILQPVSGR